MPVGVNPAIEMVAGRRGELLSLPVRHILLPGDRWGRLHCKRHRHLILCFDEPVAALIVLRGNSGSGKSTVATMLRPLVDGAWIEQDHFRRVVLGEAGTYTPLSVGLIEHAAEFCLAAGKTVIMDGIFNAAKYSAALRRLRGGHSGPSLFYAFDLSFEETLRRHGQRPGKSSDFGEEEMRGWFHGWDPLEGIDEHRIAPEESAEDIIARILADLRSGAVPR